METSRASQKTRNATTAANAVGSGIASLIIRISCDVLAQQMHNQSLVEGAARFLVCKELSDELTVWLTKGLSGEE